MGLRRLFVVTALAASLCACDTGTPDVSDTAAANTDTGSNVLVDEVPDDAPASAGTSDGVSNDVADDTEIVDTNIDDDESPSTAPTAITNASAADTITTLSTGTLTARGLRYPGPVAFSATGNRLLIRSYASEAAGGPGWDFSIHDPAAGTIESVLSRPVSDAAPAFDAELATIATADFCEPRVQRLDAQSEPLSLDALMPAGACTERESAQLSYDGRTLLVSTTRGEDSTIAPVVMRIDGGSSVDLHTDALVLEEAGFAGRSNLVLGAQLSGDGRYVTAALLSTVGPLQRGAVNEFILGTLLVDSSTGSNRVIDQQSYNQFVCDRCNPLPLPAPVISGNGRYVFYQQPIVNGSTETIAMFGLYRHDIESGNTQLVSANALRAISPVVSDDGDRIAYRAHDDVIVAYVASATTMSLKQAFRFCDGNDTCLFDRIRFVSDDPLDISRDGRGLTIFLVPQRGALASPADLSELFHVDLDTGLLSRLAPRADGLFSTISDDGHAVAQAAIDENGEETVVIVRRGDL